MSRPEYWLVAPVLMGWCLLLPGCGSGKITVKGQILEKGAPLKFEPTDQVALMFYPEVSKGEESRNHTGHLDKEGNFEVRDIPPGKYKVTFQVFGMSGKGGKPTPPTNRFQGGFGNLATTKIIREVKAGEKIIIDLAEVK